MGKISLNYTGGKIEYDVLVVGAGVSGIMAALAAAREGKSVLLCEREFALGGSATIAQVLPRMSVGTPSGTQNCSLLRELAANMDAGGDGYGENWCSPVMLRVYLENMCGKYGVKILYGMDFTASEVTDGKITGVLFNTIEGLVMYRAGCVIDATGNASVAADSGVPCEIGHNGHNQPMTLRFSASGVDVARLRKFIKSIGLYDDENSPVFSTASLWTYVNHGLRDIFEKAVNDGALEYRDGNYFQMFSADCAGKDVVWFNCPESGHIKHSMSYEEITEMILYSRTAAVRIHKFLKKYVEGFENSRINSFSEIPGVRESRRIIGNYLLTEQDFINRVKFDDAVAQTAYPIDVHDEKNLRLEGMKPGEFYEIPFRVMECCIPNLLVAGRCVSATFAAQASLRIQPTCMALGEAAGISAALGIRDGSAVRGVMIKYGASFSGK